MKKSDLKKLEEMRNDPTVKGKKLIDGVIWLNTVKPMFKMGECFEVSDIGHRVYGVPVHNFHAEIKEVSLFWQDKYIQYKLVAHLKVGDKETDTFIYKDERDLMRRRKALDNINIINGDPNKPESIDLAF